MSTPSQTNVALLTQDPSANQDAAILNLAGGGSTSQRPANPPLWFHYFDLDLGRDVIWSGTDWIVTVAGPQGFQGAQGTQGAQGFQGVQGAQGSQGGLGAQGFQGFQGPAGVQGPPGVQGPQGPAGDAIPMNYGPTSNRPVSPGLFERYFDTDINCQIWWERGAWRTVEGVPGDVKFVLSATEGDATTRNPGWVVVSGSLKGRTPVFAGQGSGLTDRTALSSFGEETITLARAEMPDHVHITGRMFSDSGSTGDDGVFRNSNVVDQNQGSGRGIAGALNAVNNIPNVAALSGQWLVTNGVEASQNSPNHRGTTAHDNMQPSYAMIGLQKQ